MALPDVDDTYRITLHMSFFGEEVLNVFFYRDTAIGGPSAASVAEGFWNKIKVAFRAFLQGSSSVIYVKVAAEQLFSPYGFAEYSVPPAEQAGSRAGSDQFMPVFNSAVVKLNVGTRATRPGSKRLWGLLEADSTQSVLAAGAVTLWGAAAALLDDTFTATGTAINLTPVIVGYPTPFLPAPPRVQDVTLAALSPYVGHQVSRDERP